MIGMSHITWILPAVLLAAALLLHAALRTARAIRAAQGRAYC